MKALNTLWLCLLILLLFVRLGASDGHRKTNEAYATLLYGDEFLLGVRVLGKSIRDTGSKKDMVVLVSDGVSDYACNLLQADGWIVEKISLLSNPNKIRPSRFWGVYTKLKIFNMTDYKKGVMVVEPSISLFNDMMNKVNTLPSYTGGDQGFLNSYYSEFPNAHVFEPNMPSESLNNRKVPEMERLSTVYNADVGLYMLANKVLEYSHLITVKYIQWMVDENELRVIHYTLGPIKPWDWWASWLVKPVDVWQNIREKLEESLPGTRGGQNPKDSLIVKFLFLFPICVVLFCCYRSYQKNPCCFGSFCRTSLFDHVRHHCHKIKSGGSVAYISISTSTISSTHEYKVPAYLGGISVCVCFMATVVSLGLAFLLVPRQVTPWTGLLLMYEWTFTIFIILFGGYLHLISNWGKTIASRLPSSSSHAEVSDGDLGKGNQRHMSSCDGATWFYGLGMTILAIAGPSMPFLFGVTALFLRLGLIVAGVIILASFMTYASEHLAIRSFLKGIEEYDIAKNVHP
ncbi:inositol phosphorylceramide glucuronosyltransferase 1 isoform X3 [Arachis duranensis]|uniref:Inositol phosphorylceramide glucuronosyltransferase 1 isoform X3 n=1 Tax=Arachis duranensis TaxID=130453 RepID=A0A9C6TAY6_ARADU|nr:inositol phosphorylceramide glucuronosyltransferase 1 isoform X3 [Arachis duranensis]